MRLLYRTAEWHGFAKLRMHTDSTLEHLTVELPREAAACKRNQQRILANASSAEHQRVVTPSQTSSADGHSANTSRPSAGVQANTPPILDRAQSESNQAMT
jgi:hypothetical protein